MPFFLKNYIYKLVIFIRLFCCFYYKIWNVFCCGQNRAVFCPKSDKLTARVLRRNTKKRQMQKHPALFVYRNRSRVLKSGKKGEAFFFCVKGLNTAERRTAFPRIAQIFVVFARRTVKPFIFVFRNIEVMATLRNRIYRIRMLKHSLTRLSPKD